ncbi:hypothetical protein C4K08_1899 [Pseudomonas chlororaphis subsp. aureofaciens]|nr:hypothetical protein C4K08_1899 [Pseudomonas chlororaphis subsp. aureofaciens]
MAAPAVPEAAADARGASLLYSFAETIEPGLSGLLSACALA